MDFREHCLEAAARLLVLGKTASSPEEGRIAAAKALADGAAWRKFRILVEAQGGDLAYIDRPELLPKARFVEPVKSPHGGYLKEVNAMQVGETSVRLGAGRVKKGDPIDHAVGIEVLHKVGDNVSPGESLFAVHASSKAQLDKARRDLLDAVTWSDVPVEPLPLFYGVVGA